MNFYNYLGTTPEYFKMSTSRRVGSGSAPQEFPLDIYNYTRATVHENWWDEVTSICRGVIINRETGEIVARPFEKFHNYGSDNS